jgi:hypoxanthine phosphoribosyltransferase
MQSHARADFDLSNNTIGLPWDAVEQLVSHIILQFQETLYVPERVLALGKGAMVPSRLLAGEGMQVFYEGISSYNEQEQKELCVYQKVHYSGDFNTPSTLIVDDIWDTGNTFRYAKGLWPLATYAALISKKPAEDTFLDYIGMVFPTEMWFNFPWEKDFT